MKPLFLIILFLAAATFSNAQKVDAVISKGNDYYRQQQYDLAEMQYKNALDKDPENTTAQYNLANAMYQQKKWGEAHGLLKKLTATATYKNLKATAYYNNGVI